MKLIVTSAVLLLAAVLLAGCRLFPTGGEGSGGASSGSQSGGEQAETFCPIDGLPTTHAALAHRPIAVMIENSPKARPQSGLSQACVVYEAITEGGITRFLVIYLHGTPPVLGPVRSSRPHFIYLAQEYDPVYVHCGESYEALQILAVAPPVLNLDQMKYSKPFWRDHSRAAPHNLYTSIDRLRSLMVSKAWDDTVPSLPNFSRGGDFTGAPAHEVNISFGGAVHYRLRLVYDQQAGGYLRYMDGKLMEDKDTGRPIVVKNVVIERVTAAEFQDSKYHTFDVSVVGNGDGYFISEGKQSPLLWSKADNRAITIYTDDKGHPLPFQPGQTWIEVVPFGSKVTITAPTPPAPPA